MRSGDQANHDCVRGKGLSRIGREVALEALPVHINGPVPKPTFASVRSRPGLLKDSVREVACAMLRKLTSQIDPRSTIATSARVSDP